MAQWVMCGFDAVAPLIVPLYLYYATELCVCVCVPQPSSTNPTVGVEAHQYRSPEVF